MAASVTHQKVSVPPTADPDLVSSNDWNDEHEVTITAADVGAAPNTGVDFLVGTATGSLTGEIVAGTSPGGELGGTWASPTVDATHSGSAHGASTTTHEAAADPHPGYVREDLMDAAGDLYVASADNTVAKLTKGSTGQMLQSQASSLAWIDYQRSQTWSKSGVLTTSTGSFRWYNDTGRTLTFVAARATAGTQPTGATIIVDVNVDGTTIMTGTKVVIAVSTNTIKQTTFSTTTIADGSYITVDVDQIGSTIAGSDLTVTIWLKG
jgi:hypothetical protein